MGGGGVGRDFPAPEDKIGLDRVHNFFGLFNRIL